MKQKYYNLFASGVTIVKASMVVIMLMILIPSPEAMATDPPVTNIGGRVNSYARVTSLDHHSKQITIDNVDGNTNDFNIGSKVLIIQMKGATINTSNSSHFGSITSLNSAGNYEFTTVVGRSGNTMWLESLERSYSTGGNIQLVSIPQYISAHVSSSITALPWNPGSGRGGVVVFEVIHELTLNADIRADGAGFKGGAINTTGNNNNANNSTFGSNKASGYGTKGEGVAAYIPNQEYGRGALANGGGGGNTHNGGGGGGGNFSAAGGGGTGWPQDGVEGGDGIGGNGFTYDSGLNKIFMGGGGGSGQQNDGRSSAGANGGGIIIIRAGKLKATNAFTISANGANASHTSGDDGAGGAGGGGTILLDILDYAIDTEVHITAKGGNGGNVDSGDKHGGGGGGGSGAVLFSLAPSDKIIIDNQAGKAGNDRRDGFTTAKAGEAPCLSSYCDPITEWYPMGSLTPLPVELLYFEGKTLAQLNLLEWATASERDNDYFTVERSIDGMVFIPLANIKGGGTKSTPTTYSFEDGNVQGKSYYYRLRQTDFDGKSTIHPIVYVPRSLGQESNVFKIGPNPFNDTFMIDLGTTIDQNVGVLIYDPNGKLVSNGHIKAVHGQAKYEYRVEENLPSGIYYLKLDGSIEGRYNPIKIIKQ